MKQCWRCKTVEGVGVHHIDGVHEDNRLTNQINLCQKCHDVVEGICGHCIKELTCYNITFRNCWRFEDSMPPIGFRPLREGVQEEKNPKCMKPLEKKNHGKKRKKPMISFTKNNKPETTPTKSRTKPKIKICNRCKKEFPWIKERMKQRIPLCPMCEFIIYDSREKDKMTTADLQKKFCPCKNLFCKILDQNVSYCHRRDYVQKTTHRT